MTMFSKLQLFVLLLVTKVSFCNPTHRGVLTRDPPVSASEVLALEVCATKPRWELIHEYKVLSSALYYHCFLRVS